MKKIVLILTIALISAIDAKSRSQQQDKPQFLEDEVTTAVVVRVKVANDTIIYGNDTERLFPKGISIDSLIRKLPGVILDDNGGITLKGLDNKVSVIIFNGREIYNVYNTKYVDLGLSVNWATCNVGADKPEDYGDYFAWGETEPKSEYTWENYKFRESGDDDWNIKFSKYGVKVDGKTVLDPEDDVAHVKWGCSWRIPSEAEFQELFDNCTTTRDSLNGIYGYRFTSKVPGYTDRSIFLPDAGNKWLSKTRDGSGIYYVNSIYVIPGKDLDLVALALITNPLHLTILCERYIGYPIRSVCPKEVTQGDCP